MEELVDITSSLPSVNSGRKMLLVENVDVVIVLHDHLHLRLVNKQAITHHSVLFMHSNI